MKEHKPMSLTSKIFISMIIGAVLGLIFGETMCQFKFIGTIWLNSIKMIMVPLVFTIMALSVGRQSNTRTLGRTYDAWMHSKFTSNYPVLPFPSGNGYLALSNISEKICFLKNTFILAANCSFHYAIK